LKYLVAILAMIQFNLTAFSQSDSSKIKKFEQQDIKDWMVRQGWIKKKPEKTSFLLLIPVIASNPSAGFIYGAGLSYAFKYNKFSERYSSIQSNATYSTKKQVNINVKSNLFVASDRLVLNGDWRYVVFTESTYGLGTDPELCDSSGYSVGLNGYETSEDNCVQQLRYTQYRLHEVASWEVYENLFVGLGIHLDFRTNIKDDMVDAGFPDSSYHYQYNKEHGISNTSYNTNGISLNFLFDSRDNQVYAYKGYYANLNFRMNGSWLGSSKNSSVLLAEYRSFHTLGKARNPHQLAIWAYLNMVTGGSLPYLELPALGYDQRQKSGRGYVFGRFRGEGILYGETEYRFPVSANTGILGGVAFFNITSASDKLNNVGLLNFWRAGYGAGLRIMLDKKSRTRLQIDAGINNRQVGFYFGAQETF
jgi:outer membrane protein assembly factor BamA